MAAFASTSCTTVPREPPPVSTELARYAVYLRGLDAAGMENEYSAVMAEVDRTPPSVSNVKLALLLSYEDGPHYDIELAMEALDELIVSDSGTNGELESIATMLFTLLGEQQLSDTRTAESSAAAETAATAEVAEASEATEALQQRVTELLAQLEQERERSQRLESQLRGLIKLEEELNEGVTP